MAYIKTGAVSNAKTSTKVTIGVITAVLVVVLVCVLLAVKNPREASQLIMSDQDYTSRVVLKNLKEKGAMYRPYLNRVTGNNAYKSKGKLSIKLSKDMENLVNSDEALESANKYVERLHFSMDTQARGPYFSNEMKLSDDRQTIFTQDFAYMVNGAYSYVPEYGYGWTQLAAGNGKKGSAEDQYRQRVVRSVLSSENKTIWKAFAKCGKTAYTAVKKDIEISKDKDQQLNFQDKQATGERVNILIEGRDAQTFLSAFFKRLRNTDNLRAAVNEELDTEDQFGSEKTFHAFLTDLENDYKNEFSDTGISKVSVDLLIDKQNIIHAFDALVKRADGDFIVNAMLDDDQHRGPALHVRSGGDTLVKFNVEKKTKTAGTIDYEYDNWKGSVSYSDFSADNGFVYGTFRFAPMDVYWSKDLGRFGLFVQMSPNVETNSKDHGFRLLVQTGFSTLGTATVEADVSEEKYTGMVTEEDIVIHDEYKEKEKRARIAQYWLSDLPKQDPEYRNALRQIVTDFVNKTLNEVTQAATKSSAKDETLSTGATK